MAYRTFMDSLPTSVWHCCKKQCFMSIAVDPDKVRLLEEISLIHDVAEVLHFEIRNESGSLGTRRRGIEGSQINFVAPSREVRETFVGTERQRALRTFGTFVLEVLPFLYGQENAPSGTECPSEKLCTQTICCILGISR